MAEFTNSVPLGQAGTGGAFILNSGKATNTFLNNIEDLKRQKLAQEQQQRLAQQKAAEDLAALYRDNALKARTGVLYDEQLSKIEGDYINQGMEAAKRGENIYDPNNPNSQAYAEKRRNIESLRNLASRDEKFFNDIMSKAQDYDPEYLNELNQYVKGDVNENLRKGLAPPAPIKRYDLEKVLAPVKALTKKDERVVGGDIVETDVIDRPSTERVIISQIALSEGGERFLNRLTGGIPITDIQRLPKTKEDIKKFVQEDFDGRPDLRKALSDAQVVEGTQRFDDWLNTETDRFYSAKQKFTEFIDKSYNKSTEGIKTSQSVKPNYAGMREDRLRQGDDDNQSADTIDYTESIPVGNKEASIRGMIRFSPTALSLGGLYAYDPDTDKQVRIPNVEDGVKVSNLAWYGFSKDGNVVRKFDGKNMGSVKGKMAQSNYAKSNEKDIVWKLASLGTYTVKEDDGTVREQRVVIDADNLPKDKKDIQKKIKALNSVNPNQQSNSTKPMTAEELIKKYSQPKGK